MPSTIRPMTFQDLIGIFVELLGAAIPVIGGLAFLVFLSGVAKFIFRIGGGGEKEVQDGKNLMIWGLVALFILVSFYGILAFFFIDFGFGGELRFPFLPV